MLGTLYIVCAVFGGTLFICQFVLSLFALGHGGTAHHGGGARHIGPHHGAGAAATGHHGLTHGPAAGGTVAGAAPAGRAGAAPGHRGFLPRLFSHRGGGGRHSVRGPGSGRGARDIAASWLASMFSFQGIVAAMTAFGLAGMASLAGGWMPWLTLASAALGAVCGMFVVAACMRVLVSLDADGTVQLEDSIGLSGTVYLAIPPRKGGLGKVLVNVHNRTMEYPAITFQDAELVPGNRIVVVGVEKPDTVEVLPSGSVPLNVEL